MSPQVEQWYMKLGSRDAHRVSATLDVLKEQGPHLGRKLVDSIKGSRHHNMKELRIGTSRVLFAFDPKQRAILLAAGDKANDWKGWYRRNIPIADRVYDEHLQTSGRNHTWHRTSAGKQSAGKGR